MAEYIERDKLLRDINHYHLSDGKFQHWVEVQPAEDVAPVRHGRWLDGKCTVCGWEEPDVGTWDGYDAEAWIETPYCPNCGSLMLEG